MSLDTPLVIPFLVPIGVVLVMVILQLFLLVVAGISLDFDLDHDTDLDVDTDIDVDGDFSLSKILSPIGVGRIPLSIVWYALGLSFGVSGLVTTFALSQFFPLQNWFLLATIPVSLLLAFQITKRVVRIVAPVFKTTGSAETYLDLIGRQGKVTSPEASESYGEISVMLNGSINHTIVKTSGETLQQGCSVVVIDVDKTSNRPIISKTS
jgi:hypothetical protein